VIHVTLSHSPSEKAHELALFGYKKKTVDWGLHNYKECPTKKSKHGRRVEGRAALIHTYLGQTIQIHYAAVEQL